MSDYLVVMITVPSREVGEKIAAHLIEAHLAACVNLVPSITSFYHWEGRLHQDEEFLLLVKTRTEEFETRFVPAVRSLHPYDLPEIIGLPIIAGLKDYLAWVEAQTGRVD